MIRLVDIQKTAAKAGVREQTIEKDYVLSWLLLCLPDVKLLKDNFIFKGGTALRKIYFPDWRYSEDLDFTLKEPASQSKITEALSSLCGSVNRKSGIALNPAETQQDEMQKTGSLVTYLSYVGPMQRTSAPRKLKLDMTLDEKVIVPPVRRKIHAEYADQKNVKREILVYPLEELCAEKMRSILQRREPRDLYDVWKILKQDEELDASVVKNIFLQKCRYKNIKFKNVNDFFTASRLAVLKNLWDKRLAAQLKNLPAFEQVIRETKRLLKSLSL